MSRIVESIRKQQKIIVLGVALAVVTLYLIPVDQIFAAVNPQVQNAIDRIEVRRLSILADDRIPANAQQQISDALQFVQYQLRSLPINS